jgi:hypothetical protein
MKLQTLENFNCVNHPSREGVGVCMAAGCRKVVCDECSTKLEGINTCLDCLNKKVNKPKRGTNWFAKSVNSILGLSSVFAGFCLIFSTFYGLGISIPSNSRASFGNRLFRNKAILEAMAKAFRSFRRDVARYPSNKESFEALGWDSKLGPQPKGYNGSYWPSAWEIKISTKDGVPLDAYDQPILYYLTPKLPQPVLVSCGSDGILETELEILIKKYRKTRDLNRLTAMGDDQITIVR